MDDTVVKLLLALLVGGLIGVERNSRVGLGQRTMMLICLGAAMGSFLKDTEIQAFGIL